MLLLIMIEDILTDLDDLRASRSTAGGPARQVARLRHRRLVDAASGAEGELIPKASRPPSARFGLIGLLKVPS
jgi:hypothetical protein